MVTQGIMMKLIRQPNAYSCTLASAAMVFDTTTKNLIRIIGHDGSAIIFPNLPEPIRRKGFHFQEIVDAAEVLGFALIPIEAEPVQTPNGVDEYALNFPESRFYNHIFGNPGLISGMVRKYWHCIAWDGEKVYDPNGRIYDLSDCKIDIQVFWKIK